MFHENTGFTADDDDDACFERLNRTTMKSVNKRNIYSYVLYGFIVCLDASWTDMLFIVQ